MPKTKPLRWLNNPETGAWLSEGSRFYIHAPRTVEGWTKRITLSDRVGDKTDPKNPKMVKYLCLTVESAKELAEDIRAGKGVLSP
jgi:hypothetical protein